MKRVRCPGCGKIEVMKFGEDAEYVCSSCNTDMVEYQLNPVDIEKMNIFRTGKWKGITFGNKELDEMIQNFNGGIVAPYLKLTETGEHTPRQPLLRALAFGWVSRLYREGDRLYADYKQVPSEVADLIDAGALKKKSVELFINYRGSDGNLYGYVLKSILMFGAGVPAVWGLEDAVKIHEHTDEETESHEFDEPEMPRGVRLLCPNCRKRFVFKGPRSQREVKCPRCGLMVATTLPKKPAVLARGAEGARHDGGPDGAPGTTNGKGDKTLDIAELRYQELLKKEVEQDHLTKVLSARETELGTLTEKAAASAKSVEDKDKEIVSLKEKVGKHEAALLQEKKATCASFLDDMIKEGRVQPSEKDSAVAHMAALEGEALEEYKKLLSNRPDVFPKQKGKDQGPNFDGKNEDDEMDAKIKERMKKANLDYIKAEEQILAEMQASAHLIGTKGE